MLDIVVNAFLPFTCIDPFPDTIARPRILMRGLVGAFLIVFLLIALIFFKQHSLVYHPRPYDPDYARTLPPNGEEISYLLSLGKQTAFYVPAPNEGRLPGRLWIAFCGNGSLALDCTTILTGYPNSNDAFLLVDYPGYGKCQGYATIASTRASSDAALNTLAKRLVLSEEEMESRLCTIGHSLGSAVAIDFAARHRVQRVVAISPFTTLREEAARIGGAVTSADRELR